MNSTLFPETLEETCKRLEHFETDPWAARAIVAREPMTDHVIDPCAGTGILTIPARAAGHRVTTVDIHDWGFPLDIQGDFLTTAIPDAEGATIFMNPPFSLAVEFVRRALEIGAGKVVMFQRFAFWESEDRREFWENTPPARVLICGNRATCWRHDLPKDDVGNRYDPKAGKKLASSSTAHAFFIWEKGQAPGTQLGHIWRTDCAP